MQHVFTFDPSIKYPPLKKHPQITIMSMFFTINGATREGSAPLPGLEV